LLRHRDAWSVEQTAPSRDEWLREQAKEQTQERSREERERREARVAPSSAAAPTPVLRSDDLPRDVLIVASKLKAYIRARSGMNTSDAVMEVLSDVVRSLCDRAVEKAAQAGRKTVLDRDF
jgi:histone H3/H4